MEILQETKRRLLELETTVDEATKKIFPPELTRSICREYVTSKRVLLERVIIETCWKKQKSNSYDYFIRDLYQHMELLVESSLDIRQYFSDLMFYIKFIPNRLLCFQASVAACSVLTDSCHRLSCFYNDGHTCICTDPIRPRDFFLYF